MQIEFFKYQGAGNDFVFLNNFDGKYDNLTIDQVRFLCNRRFGVGADGLIKIDESMDWDFSVDYFNADGTKSFCGNGARCAVRFVHENLLKKDKYRFMAIDGVHSAQLTGELISLEMMDVRQIEEIDPRNFVLHTGSPHYVSFRNDIRDLDVNKNGSEIRYSNRFSDDGINVNFVQITAENELSIRTYERGVEGETLACGTGITAAALAYAYQTDKMGDIRVSLKAEGGRLSVKMNRTGSLEFKAIQLIGPAEFVFKGSIDVL